MPGLHHWAFVPGAASQCLRFEAGPQGAFRPASELPWRGAVPFPVVDRGGFRGRAVDFGRGAILPQRTADRESVRDRYRAGIHRQVQRGFHAVAVLDLFRPGRRPGHRLLRICLCGGHGRLQCHHRDPGRLHRQNRSHAAPDLAGFRGERGPVNGSISIRFSGDCRGRGDPDSRQTNWPRYGHARRNPVGSPGIHRGRSRGHVRWNARAAAMGERPGDRSGGALRTGHEIGHHDSSSKQRRQVESGPGRRNWHGLTDPRGVQWGFLS